MTEEEERHSVAHMQHQVDTHTIDHPECCFDVGLVETVLALIERQEALIKTIAAENELRGSLDPRFAMKIHATIK